MADFLEGAPGETISRNVEVEMDRMESNISKQGYTDGFLAGKEEGTQIGFDIGFKEGAGLGSKWGMMEGKIAAMKYLHPAQAGELKLLLDELKDSFDEQNRYFSQFGEDRQSSSSTASHTTPFPSSCNKSSDNQPSSCSTNHQSAPGSNECCGGGSASAGCCNQSAQPSSSSCCKSTAKSGSFETDVLMSELDSLSSENSSCGDKLLLFEQRLKHIVNRC